MIDSERMRLALVNLMENARHAVTAAAPSLAGAPTGIGAMAGPGASDPAATEPAEARVFLSTRPTARGVAIVIADTGVGIESADLPRVFDPFFTTKRGGTGLGLPIAKNIIDGLGGAITVASAPGRGTEIRIELPIGGPAH
jgi:signal transduction histidine kinase